MRVHPTNPNVLIVTADELEIGDIILNETNFTPIDHVYDIYSDHDGVWLETNDSLGYISEHYQFFIEA